MIGVRYDAKAVPRFASAGGSKVGAEVHRGEPPAR